MIKKKKIIIDVCGVPGVGKSTIVSEIIASNNNFLFYPNISFFDLYSIKEYKGSYLRALSKVMIETFKSIFYSGKIVNFFLLLFFQNKINFRECITQIQFNSRMIATFQKCRLISTSSIIIRDGGLGNVVSEAAMYDLKKSKTLFKDLLVKEIIPDIIIFLSADYKIIMNRFKLRPGRIREKQMYSINSGSFYKRFMAHNETKFFLTEQSGRDNFKIYDVNASGDIKETLNKVKQIIDKVENRIKSFN